MRETTNIFPIAGDDVQQYGIEARDYIAIQAMTGLLANPQLIDCPYSTRAKSECIPLVWDL